MTRATRIVFMGTPEIAAFCLDALIQAQFNIVGIVTVADKAAGRGKQMLSSPVKLYAHEHELPILQPEKLRDPDFLHTLASWEADLFVVVAFRMLPKVVWDMPPMGSINLHASLLPQYRGAAPIQHVIFNGETQTGVTCFLLNEDIDSGHILSQQSIAITSNETGGSLHDKIMHVGAELLIQTIDQMAQGDLKPMPQVSPDSPVKLAPKIFKEHGLIDWQQDAETIDRQIRALCPYPGAYTFVSRNGSEPLMMKIFEVKIEDNKSNNQTHYSGKLCSDGKNSLSVDLNHGQKLYIIDLQLSGKRRMLTHEFLQGVRDITDYKLTS